jgi:hypothetical protein
MLSQSEKSIFTALSDSWPSPVVPREKLEQFTGGMISAKRMANIESAHRRDPAQPAGPEGAIRCGRRVVYPKDALIRWLESRSKAA